VDWNCAANWTNNRQWLQWQLPEYFTCKLNRWHFNSSWHRLGQLVNINLWWCPDECESGTEFESESIAIATNNCSGANVIGGHCADFSVIIDEQNPDVVHYTATGNMPEVGLVGFLLELLMSTADIDKNDELPDSRPNLDKVVDPAQFSKCRITSKIIELMQCRDNNPTDRPLRRRLSQPPAVNILLSRRDSRLSREYAVKKLRLNRWQNHGYFS